MRWISSLALAFFLAATPSARRPFPLPTVDGKPLSVTAEQRVFQLPQRLPKVEAFYREQFATEPQVRLTVRIENGRRRVTLISKRPGDGWTRATLDESELGTTVEVTPVIEFAEEQVEGSARPLVEFIFTRSPEVDRQLKSIDHLER